MKNLDLSDACELFGLILVAVAIGALFGAWWGVFAGGIELVGYGFLLDDGVPPSGDAGCQ